MDLEKDGKVSLVERKTNEDVLIMVDEKRELLNRIKTKKRWIGHNVRGNGLLKVVIEGSIDGRRPRERERNGV